MTELNNNSSGNKLPVPFWERYIYNLFPFFGIGFLILVLWMGLRTDSIYIIGLFVLISAIFTASARRQLMPIALIFLNLAIIAMSFYSFGAITVFFSPCNAGLGCATIASGALIGLGILFVSIIVFFALLKSARSVGNSNQQLSQLSKTDVKVGSQSNRKFSKLSIVTIIILVIAIMLLVL